MRLSLCLFVFVSLVAAVTRHPVRQLDPFLVELGATTTVEQTGSCVLTLTKTGTCTTVTAPSTGWICGRTNCDPTGLTLGYCMVNSTSVNTYSYLPNCACSSLTCSTQVVYKTEACRYSTRCACVNGVGGTTSCTQNNLCNGAACPTTSYPLPTCSLGAWTAWGACNDPATGLPVFCDYDNDVAQSGIQVRYRDPIRNSTCTGGVRETQSQPCSATCPPEPCVQGPWEEIQPCPACWNRRETQFVPQRVEASIIYSFPHFGGAQCSGQYFVDGRMQSNTDCDIAVCPTDCEVSDWSEWCTCDKTCVDTRSDCRNCGGITSRERKVVTQPQDGGLTCPHLRETKSCNEIPCPIDCQMSTWSAWSQCNARCGGGQRLRTRYILLSSQYNGKPCEDLSDFEVCNTNPCPVSCKVSDWSDWDVQCPKCINEGQAPVVRTKRRSIISSAEYGGADCPALEYSQQCQTTYCPIPCQYTPWSDWTQCTATCGGGIRYHRRAVLVSPAYGGAACTESLYEQEACNTWECPFDCVYAWGPYVACDGSGYDCSKQCGGGCQQREIQILVQPRGGGKACPPSPEQQPCNTGCCPQDCVVSDWDLTVEQCQSAEYCPAKCDIGFCVRSRNVTTQSRCGGSFCPPLTDYVPCKVRDCDVPCLWSEWSGWSLCPSCGETSPDVKRYREKKLLQGTQEVCGGDDQGKITEQEPCPLRPCPVDCKVSDWQDSPCSVTCGVGFITRTRSIIVSSAYGGARCPYLTEFKSCVLPACVPPCVISEWSEWGPCSATCRTGDALPFQTRHRTILRTGTGDCGQAPLEESEPCNIIPCPVPCFLSDWSDWSPNPCGFVNGVQKCGLNLQTRTRSVITQPANGGRICQITHDQQYCDAGPCERPCEFTPWSEWSTPSATCGKATRTRHRYLLNSDGRVDYCPHVSERQEVASSPPCPVDCEFYYSDWGDCSPQGYRRRHVIITRQAENGGRPCPTCQVERDDCTPPPSGVEECWLEDCEQ